MFEEVSTNDARRAGDEITSSLKEGAPPRLAGTPARSSKGKAVGFPLPRPPKGLLRLDGVSSQAWPDVVPAPGSTLRMATRAS